MNRRPFFPSVVAVLALTVGGCESAPTDPVEPPLASATTRHSTQGFATVEFSTPSVDRGLAQGVRRVSGNGSIKTHALVVIFDPFGPFTICQSLVFIPDSDFTWSMNSATLKASTACGDVDLSWSRTGPVTTNPVNQRSDCLHRVITGPHAVASVAGTHNGEAVAAIQATIARQTDVLTICTGS